MKRNIIFIVLICLLVNMLVFTRGNIAYGVEPEIIWLDKEYYYVESFSGGIAFVMLGDK